VLPQGGKRGGLRERQLHIEYDTLQCRVVKYGSVAGTAKTVDFTRSSTIGRLQILILPVLSM
jgi:hypothetical protein